MKTFRVPTALTTAALLAVLTAGGCGQEESKVDQAIEGTKDALDMREYEPVKDAAEDAADAIEDAADRTRDAVEDAVD